MLREMVAEFTASEVEPQAAAYDEKGVLNVELFRRAGELGLLGVTIPEEDGGAGMDATAAVIVFRCFAASSSSDPPFNPRDSPAATLAMVFVTTMDTAKHISAAKAKSEDEGASAAR